MTRSNTVTVYVPCDAAAVHVRLGFGETLTPIEAFVLRTVHAGIGTLPELANALGLSMRLTLDVVQDLWHTRYVRLVRAHAGVEVTAKVAQAIAAGTLHQLAGAEAVDDTRIVMIDKLSGHVLPASNIRAPEVRKFAVPVENSPLRIGDVPAPEILEAVQRGLEKEEQERHHDARSRRDHGPARSRRVLSARLAPDQIGSAGRRWLPVDVRLMIDPDTDRLVFSVVGDALPESRREAATQALTRFADQHPKDDFVQALRGQAAPGLLDAPSLVKATARLREQAVTAAGIPAGRRRSWHLTLCDLDRQLTGMFDDQVDREVRARPVPGAAQHEELRQLIRSARAQLVLTGPFVRYDALAAILSDLREALRRGVQVVLLWGIAHDDELDERVRNLLYDLELRSAGTGEGGLLVPKTSARTHAKLAVADDHTALVTSWNMLNQADPQREAGVVVTAPQEVTASQVGASCRTVRDLLAWARTAVPGYEMSRRLLVVEGDFVLRGIRAGQPEPAAGTGSAPALPDRPLEPTEADDVDGDRDAAVWSDAWIDRADRIAELIAERTHPPARVVLDGAHRDLMWHAVRTAERRLVITSDMLSGQVVDERMVAALRAALDRGVEVTIVYGRVHPKSQRAATTGKASEAGRTSAVERLLHRLEQAGGQVRIERNGNHAKVLVWDDDALVSSFNFLSFEGYYTVGAAHRQRSEVGLWLAGRAVADAAARAVGVEVWSAPRSGVRVAPARPPAREGSYVVAQRILTDVASGVDPAEAVALHLDGDAHPWRTLEQLDAVTGRLPRSDEAQDPEPGARPPGAGHDVLRSAAATCLHSWPDAAPPGARDRWTRWLVEDLWMQGRAVEAMLLRTMVADEAFRPGPLVAALAAARGGPLYVTALDHAAEVLDRPAALVGQAASRASTDSTALDQADGVPDEPVRLDASGAGPLWERWISERTAVFAAALELTLAGAGPDPAGLLELELEVPEPAEGAIDDRLDESWRNVAQAALAYTEVALGQPLPVDAIRGELFGEHDSQTRREAWSRLATALDRTASTKLDNTASLHTHMHLFGQPEGLFTRLAAIVSARDRVRVRTWLTELPTADPGIILNEAAAVAAPGKQPMYGTYRKRYVRLLQKIIDDTRALCTLLERTDGETWVDSASVALVAAARPLAEVLEGEWEHLTDLTERMNGPEGLFVQQVLGGLGELRQWATMRAADVVVTASGTPVVGGRG